MSLRNLVGTSLDTIEPTRERVASMLASARRQIADAKASGISAETRFSSAYAAIRVVADIGLHAHGYRVLASRPGHHQVAIQSLRKSLGVTAESVIVLDGLRKQRNLIEYMGESVPESMVKACIAEAEGLLSRAMAWLSANRPALM